MADGYDSGSPSLHPSSGAPTWCLDLCRDAAAAVPAYATFLLTEGYSTLDLAASDDFCRVPIVTKSNYLQAYPLHEMLWKGEFQEARIISTSSGSSGVPFYWPRGEQSQEDAVRLNESMFRHFNTKQEATLCINAFAMGTYIAATYELAAIMGLAERGHQITAVCPGIDVEDSVRILRDLAPSFSQTVIMGYPPLVRDIVEAAKEEDVPLGERNLRFVLAGENFSEHWRERLHATARVVHDLDGSFSIYGTADAGIVGVESPLTVHVRKLAAADEHFRTCLFPGVETLPSLLETDPSMRYVEEVDGDIVFTARNALPLIRYRIGDQGRVFTLKELSETARSFGHELPRELTEASTGHFVGLYGRADVAATFYSVNIYPENVKRGLESPVIEDRVTGKFVISSVESVGGREALRLEVELAPRGAPSPSLRSEIEETVLASLLRSNAEFRRLHQALGRACRPAVVLLANGHPHFKIEIKHRWTGRAGHAGL